VTRDLLGQILGKGSKAGSDAAIEIARADVIGELRLGRPASLRSVVVARRAALLRPLRSARAIRAGTG
jgi:hypothetical protein